VTRPDEEPYHRKWLHAMEAEPTVPGTVMQVARIYADYAASRGGHSASVSYPVLIRQTHRSRDALAEAHEWMTVHGWLCLQAGKDGKPWREGQRKTYDLTFGRSGEKRKAVRLPERSNQSGEQTGSSRKWSDDRNGSGEADQSEQRTATSPNSRPRPVRQPERERLTSDNVSLPRLGSLHAMLAAAVPDVTGRETELVTEMVAKRPGVRSPTAVLRCEIADGNGPSLVAEVRRRQSAGSSARSWCGQRDLCDERTGMLLDEYGQPGSQPCPTCHPAPSSGRRPEYRLTATEPPSGLSAAPERCRAGERCLRPPLPIDTATGYHARCEAAAAARASMSARTADPAKNGGEAA
jgi:hypothetical protein